MMITDDFYRVPFKRINCKSYYPGLFLVKKKKQTRVVKKET